MKRFFILDTVRLPLLQCDVQAQVNRLLELHQSFRRSPQDTAAIEAPLKKVLAPTFELVFAGAFSAGKLMLINALLERELLYSAEGHATGTECYIEYAPPQHERVVLTFLSEAEIKEQAIAAWEKEGANHLSRAVILKDEGGLEVDLVTMCDVLTTIKLFLKFIGINST